MTWTLGTAAPLALNTTAAAGYGGKLYVLGDSAATPGIPKSYVYDPTADTWTTLTAPPSVLGEGTAMVTIGSKIYMFNTNGSSGARVFYIYDPATDTYTDKSSGLPTSHAFVGSATTDGTKLYALLDLDGDSLPYGGIYDPTADTWDTTTIPKVPSALAPNLLGWGALFLISGTLISVNGWNAGAAPDGVVLLCDLTTNTWSAGASVPFPREGYAINVDGLPVAACIGGDDASVGDSTTVQLYDPTTDSWTAYDALNVSRDYPGAAVVGSKLYVVGGNADDSLEWAPLPLAVVTTVDLDATGENDTGGLALIAGELGAAGENDNGGEATIDLILPPPTVPAGMTGVIRQRRSYTYNAPAVDTTTGVMVKQTRTLYVAEPWGYTQIVIEGYDRTWVRGVRTRIGSPMVWAVPGGPTTVTLVFPLLRPFEDLTTALAIPRIDGAFIGIYKRHADHSRADDWSWEGLAHAKRPVVSGDDWHWEVDAKGFLHQAEDGVNQPPFEIYSTSETDIGRRAPQVLNSWTGRRYHAIPARDIGVTTLLRGSFGQSRLQMIQDLFALAWTADGRQWRINDVQGPGRRFQVELPGTAVNYHVSVGGDGVDLSNLVDEADEAPNVIFGEWVDAQGNRSQNVKYPHLHEDTAPPYPLPDPQVFNPGDGHTGFAPFATWLRDHGAGLIHSGNTYDSRDEDDVRAAQARMGVTVDGVVGRQTWGTAFNTGANVGDLGAVAYFPLADDPRTQPRLHTPDGQDIGPNPAYDPTLPVREVKIDFGSGVTRTEVVAAARAMIHRNTTGRNYTGEIRLTGDPEECSRIDIRHGDIISVRYLDNSGSTGVAFHIAQVSHDDPEADDYPVTLTVDTRYRDAPTLTQLLQNQREARNDPARVLRRQETGRLTQSTRTPFDLDNAAGKIYTHAIQGGFWRVVQFPASAYGEFVDLIATTSPARAFVLGLFVKPVTPNYLAAKVGNPLDPSNDRPFDVNRADLRAAGLIQGWGSGVQPGGYSDGYTGAKTAGDPLTGKIEDDGSTKYASFNPPWLWLAEYCTGGNTNITVTFLNAPEVV